MKKIKKVLVIISNVVMAMAIVILLFVAPILLGVRPYIVLSGSMEPTIHTGSLAYVNTKVNPDSLEVGDVITYHIGEVTVTHRIIDSSEEGFHTKGDANDMADGNLIPKEDVEGKVVVAVPYAGFVANFLVSPRGKVVVVWLIFCVLMSLWL